MKALIQNSNVVDVAEQEFPVHSSLTWMDCPDETVAGQWHLVDGSLQAMPQENQLTMDRLREKRDDLLYKSDWTDSPKNALTDEQHAAWEAYRTELRDLPANTPDPANPSWPVVSA